MKPTSKITRGSGSAGGEGWHGAVTVEKYLMARVKLLTEEVNALQAAVNTLDNELQQLREACAKKGCHV